MIIIDTVYDELLRLYILAEPRTKDWLICKSAWIMIGIIALYLYIINISGPAFMKKRKPYNLKTTLILYNILQVVFNLVIFVSSMFTSVWQHKFACQSIDYSNTPDAIRVLNIIWYYFLLKIFDLLDTIFFILRKKTNQVTSLHLYHHTGMIILVWMGLNFTPGGHAILLGIINTFVHMIMYSYYLLTSCNIGKIWWKKYVTQLQIIQFIVLLVQHTLGILQKDCAFPKIPLILLIPHNILLLILFLNFYIKTYVKKESSERIDQNEVSNKTNDNRIKLSNEKSKFVGKIE